MEENVKKEVKNILFELQIEGRGIVNYDGDGQKYIEKQRHNNISYAKKNFYKDNDGKITSKVKISSNSLRHSIFRNRFVSQTPSIVHHEALMYSYLSTPYALLSGYMLTMGSMSYKKKSVLNICDAEQINDALPIYELHTRSGEKQTMDDSIEVKEGEDKKDTTLYNKNTTGSMKYLTVGNIDLESLEFYSCDQIFDRFAFNPDMFSMYKTFLTQNIPGFDSELKYHKLKTTSFDIAEYGFQMSQESRKYLLKLLLTDTLLYENRKTGAYAKTAEFKVKVVVDPFVNEEWVVLKNETDIDNFLNSIELYDFYSEVDQIEAQEKREEISKKQKEDNVKAKKPVAKKSKKVVTKTTEDEVS